jgi:NADH:ubiquinone oxidoreductase subunit 6 (subunit J)
MMSKIEKRLCILAIVFVVVYLGAAALTLQNRFSMKKESQPRIESMVPTRAESRLAMVELFLPMIVLLTIAISYVIVKKKRAKQIVTLEESEDEIEESEYQTHPPVQE